jgi:hypothetical protein
METPGMNHSLQNPETLEALQRETFDYFVFEVNPLNGLVADRTQEGAPASIAAVGLALSAYPVDRLPARRLLREWRDAHTLAHACHSHLASPAWPCKARKSTVFWIVNQSVMRYARVGFKPSSGFAQGKPASSEGGSNAYSAPCAVAGVNVGRVGRHRFGRRR